MASVHPSYLFTPSPAPPQPSGVGGGTLACPSSSLPSAAVPRPRRLRQSAALPAVALEPSWGSARWRPSAPLLLVILLVGVATLVAPEQPHAQEAICHRHRGVEACLVW
jgi:hypothetical protein